jgi:hypothetical protein
LSPGLRQPTPDGVPVRIRSPSFGASWGQSGKKQTADKQTSKVMIDDICSISRGMRKIMSAVEPFCLILPFNCTLFFSGFDIGNTRPYLEQEVQVMGIGYFSFREE